MVCGGAVSFDSYSSLPEKRATFPRDITRGYWSKTSRYDTQSLPKAPGHPPRDDSLRKDRRSRGLDADHESRLERVSNYYGTEREQG